MCEKEENMKKFYVKPELEVLLLENESILAGTGATDDPSHPGGKIIRDESREIFTFDE